MLELQGWGSLKMGCGEGSWSCLPCLTGVPGTKGARHQLGQNICHESPEEGESFAQPANTKWLSPPTHDDRLWEYNIEHDRDSPCLWHLLVYYLLWCIQFCSNSQIGAVCLPGDSTCLDMCLSGLVRGVLLVFSMVRPCLKNKNSIMVEKPSVRG
jgi:hypothetical protein